MTSEKETEHNLKECLEFVHESKSHHPPVDRLGILCGQHEKGKKCH